MCQLLGMNCNTPTDIMFSFEGFRRRGGITDHHADGFGIGFFEGKGVRLFHDDKPSANSPVADLVRAYQIKSENVVAHIRKASQGQTSLANTHPFMREMWGGYWLFAHNGHLIDFFPEQGEFFHPVGTTDSERAFCLILNRLRTRFDTRPDDETLFDAIAGLTHEIRKFGLFNFMLSDGIALFAHASTLLHYIVRQAPFGKARLLDDDVMVDFAEVTTPSDRVAVIATLPLTRDETWAQLAVDELVMFREGKIILNDRPRHPVYMSVEEGLETARAAGVAV
ncbi:TPA: class II glutamine amidotransferase [Neisseria meningitidis]|uniref:class II glutamine amidotransferase n=1 Tax=Neisseria meningitidis TaxID=487 RepID=UPI000FCB3A81|nr:class II glutamine amidotransferase [Neisseria meningitidis]MCL4977829.1 class II glutamine amidotransferase [Neisseria meningitidis]MCL4998209.1 class II glutamine amidotransferase [Neisseria meningitidis]MCL5763280.1 class II glutamine amidotransferase [Neisseria meningitidis]MCL5864040.1 class II glutamine amidotransferase [Neisseria meningitidis]MCL6137456.1 class II glutamine amidotransferase [Neisseria meningitidis]